MTSESKEGKPNRIVDAGEDKTGTATIYLWVVPETIPNQLMQSLEAREGTPEREETP